MSFQFLEKLADSDNDTISYEGIRYERSDTKFVRLPLNDFLKDRDIALPFQLQKLCDILPAGVFIAGGAVAGLVSHPFSMIHFKNGDNWVRTSLGQANDIDLFFANEEAFNKTVGILGTIYQRVEKGVPEGVVMFTPPSFQGDLPVQAVQISWFEGGAESILDSFDFTAIQFAIDVGAKELVYNPVAPIDYSQKLLVTIHPDESTLEKRIRKYVAKGFTPVGVTKAELRTRNITL